MVLSCGQATNLFGLGTLFWIGRVLRVHNLTAAAPRYVCIIIQNYYYYYFYYYSYYYVLQLSCHSVAVVLTAVQTEQLRINIHKRNNTKTQYKKYKTQ
jgi:hypothetical protein